MSEISIIGLDLAKLVFQVHGADERGQCMLRKQLKRCDVLAFFAKLKPCIVAMEACGTAHYWAREIAKLGHEVRLIPPAYVKAFVKRGKSDRIDAEAICEAASLTMRFVPVKSMENQALATLHRSRDLLIKNRTMQVNALRGHLAEFGFVAAKGIGKLPDLIKIVSEAPAEALPDMVRVTLSGFLDAIALITAQVAAIEKRLVAWHKTSEDSKHLKTAPGIGLMVATALLRPGSRSLAVQERPSLRGLDRHRAKARRHWRQDAARAHLQGRQPLSAPAVRAGRHLAVALAGQQNHAACALGTGASGPALQARRDGCARQQARAHRLGRHGQGRGLQAARRSRARKRWSKRMSGPAAPIPAPCSRPSTPLARRVPRWPPASVDRHCARRFCGVRPGRRNGPQPNRETAQQGQSRRARH